jgi:hypothetical protein
VVAVSLVLLALAAFLVPWIGLLIAFNPTSATAFHVHLTTLGLGAASAAAAAVAALGFLAGALWAAPAALVCGTLTGASTVGILVTTEAAWARVAAGGFVCAGVALAAGLHSVGAAERAERVRGRLLAAALLAVALAVVAGTVLLLVDQPRSFTANHVRLAWVWLDVAELLSLANAGLALRRNDPSRALVAGCVGAALLSMDAWVNVTIVPGGAPLAWAIVFALVGELPSAFLCAWAARAGARALRRA